MGCCLGRRTLTRLGSDGLHLAGRRHEQLIRPIGRSVYLMPPYLVDDELAHWLAERLRATLDELLETPNTPRSPDAAATPDPATA